jgi:hypothetical protein
VDRARCSLRFALAFREPSASDPLPKIRFCDLCTQTACFKCDWIPCEIPSFTNQINVVAPVGSAVLLQGETGCSRFPGAGICDRRALVVLDLKSAPLGGRPEQDLSFDLRTEGIFGRGPQLRMRLGSAERTSSSALFILAPM